MLDSNPNSPTFLFDDLSFHWQMTRCEKYGFASLLEAAKPQVAIEIGTYKGGSLQMIAKHAEKVYSLDISPNARDSLASHFNNVEFLVGDSRELLPGLINTINDSNQEVGFVLIDGDHTAKGVKADINAVLELQPKCAMYIVFHDSFHPPCREGILAAKWSQCEFVHYVELDFVPGVFHEKAFDTAVPKSMYGGLAVALMLPNKRTENLTIHQSQKGLFDTVFRHSCHKGGWRQFTKVLKR